MPVLESPKFCLESTVIKILCETKVPQLIDQIITSVNDEEFLEGRNWFIPQCSIIDATYDFYDILNMLFNESPNHSMNSFLRNASLRMKCCLLKCAISKTIKVGFEVSIYDHENHIEIRVDENVGGGTGFYMVFFDLSGNRRLFQYDNIPLLFQRISLWLKKTQIDCSNPLMLFEDESYSKNQASTLES